MTPPEIQGPFQRVAGLESEPVHLRRGEVLFRQGDSGDCLYLVRCGRLRAIYDWMGPNERVLGDIARGEPAGELALISQSCRSATVVATRDTELAMIPMAAFEHLAETNPRDLLELMRVVAERLKNTYETGHREALPSSIAVVAANNASPLRDYCERLQETLAEGGLLCAHLASRQLPDSLGDPFQPSAAARWLDDTETRADTLILETDPSLTDWTRLCLRHADLVLVLAVAGTDETPGEVEAQLIARAGDAAQPRVDLVLLHGSNGPIANTQAWLGPRAITRHHHIRIDSDADRRRALRLLTGHDVSLVLGGGGARGFAHIGVFRALTEAGIPIDRIGGTSMGAIVGAWIARGLDWKEIARELRHHFTECGRLTRFTIPAVSIDTARGYLRLLDRMYGGIRIEDLPVNFFCVSCNLTRAKVVVHREGRLAEWIGASMSVPGVAPPLFVRGEMLVDGGVLNNLPIDIARADGAGKVIGVDVSPDVELALAPDYNGRPTAWEALRSWLPRRKRGNTGPGNEACDGGEDRGRARAVPGLFAILNRVSSLSSITAKEDLKRHADLIIKVPVGGFRMFAWERVDDLVELGYRIGMDAIARWQNDVGARPPQAHE